MTGDGDEVWGFGEKKGCCAGWEEVNTWVLEQPPGSVRGEASVTAGLKFGPDKWSG